MSVPESQKGQSAVLVAVIGAAAVVIAAVIGIIPQWNWKLPKSDLRISSLRLLDETVQTKTNTGAVLTDYVPRASTEITFKDPKELSIAFVFQVEGYQTRGDLQIDLTGTITVQKIGGRKFAEGPLPKLSSAYDWRERPSVKQIGLPKIMSALRLPEIDTPKTPIPYLVILNDFEPDEVPDGLTEVVVMIHDGIVKANASDKLTIRVSRSKPLPAAPASPQK